MNMIEENKQQKNEKVNEIQADTSKKDDIKSSNNSEYKLVIGDIEYKIKFSKAKNEENSLSVILVDSENSITEYFQCIYSIEKLISCCNVFQLFDQNIDEIIKFICKNFEDNKNLVGIYKDDLQFTLKMKLINEQNKEEQIFSIKMDKIKLNQEEINTKFVQEIRDLNKKIADSKKYQADFKKIIKVLVEEIQSLKDDNLFKDDLLTKIILRLNNLENQKSKQKGKGKMTRTKNSNSNTLGTNANPFMSKNLKNQKNNNNNINKDNSQMNMYGIDYGYSERADESFISSMSNLNLCKDMENRINYDIENIFKDTDSEFNFQDNMMEKKGKKNAKQKNQKKKKVNKYEQKPDNLNYGFPNNQMNMPAQNNFMNQNQNNQNNQNDNVSSQIMKIINSGSNYKGFIPKSLRTEQNENALTFPKNNPIPITNTSNYNNNKTEPLEGKKEENKLLSSRLVDIINNDKHPSYIPKFMRKNINDTTENNNNTFNANTNVSTNNNININNNELKINPFPEKNKNSIELKINEVKFIPKKIEVKQEIIKQEEPKKEEPKKEDTIKQEKPKKEETINQKDPKIDESKKEETKKEMIDNNTKSSELDNNNDTDMSKVEKVQVIKIAKNTTLTELDSKIITDQKELDLLENRLKQKVNFKLKGLAYKLIYRASKDGEKEFHSHCNNCHQSLCLIKTSDGYRFGGYTKLDWSGRNIEKIDSYSFVFSLDYLKIYNVKKGKNSIFCDGDYGPCFSGVFYITHEMLSNESECCSYSESNYNGIEYDYEFTDGNRFFYIDELEVFKINFY